MPDFDKSGGTQSFVHVMSAVWGRPSLAGLEIGWRWVVGIVILAASKVAFGNYGVEFGIDITALQAASVFQPVAAIRAFHVAVNSLWHYALPILGLLVPPIIVLWLVAAALGRTLVLRRMDPTLKPRRLTLVILGTIRAGLISTLWVLWFWMVRWGVRVTLTGPAASHSDPNLVLFFAIAIVASLFLYVVWGVLSWPFYMAPLLAMQRNVGPIVALNAAFRGTAVRSKLIEINLVMNIVRIALIVLAMVFSASPLPFSNVETQTFLNWWWTGVVLVYLAMSDYFHVVRSAAYLSLWRASDISA